MNCTEKKKKRLMSTLITHHTHKKNMLETRVSFGSQLLSSATWLVDFSAHSAKSIDEISNRAAPTHSSVKSQPKQSISLAATVCGLLLKEQNS